MRENSSVLSMAMAQTQTEQINSPTITLSTIQWACQNRWNSERLLDVKGATYCAMSAGFMKRVLSAVRETRPLAGASPAR